MNGKRKSAFMVASLVVVIGVVAVILLLNRGGHSITKFEQALEEQQFATAVQIFEEKLQGDELQEAAVEEVIEQQIMQVKKNYFEASIPFEEVVARLEGLAGLKDSGLPVAGATEALEQMGVLHQSREAFQVAAAHVEQEEWKEAFMQLQKVITADKANYEQAQQWLTDKRSSYIEQVLEAAKQLAVEEKYSEALQFIADNLEVLTDEEQLIAAELQYEEQLAEQEEQLRLAAIEEAKETQLLTVEAAKLVVQHSEFKALYPDMIELLVKNNSEQTVKNFKVGIVAYDENGYPVTLKGQLAMGETSYVLTGQANNVNLLPEKVYGAEKGWAVSEGQHIVTVLANVQSAEFYDGTEWVNEYYEHWLEIYKEQPLTETDMPQTEGAEQAEVEVEAGVEAEVEAEQAAAA